MAEPTLERPRLPGSEADEVIAATKLQVPAPRPGLVARTSLIALLCAPRPQRLTLLDAPPGSGKTTLLAQWHAAPEEQRAFAWLSLDREDGDPVRFWSCVIEAVRTVVPGIGGRARGALRVQGVGLTELVLPLLLNELASVARPLVLVLDDYHLLTDARLHESVAYFVEHLPDQVHLAIATRSDPPLPLGRLRARGEMTEIRAGELRFNEQEAESLLTSSLGRDLDRSDVARLLRRTEGWAAGLYLAALSMRGRPDARAFVESFAGDDRHIVDYLLAEVLDAQPEEVRAFLLRTSVLDALSGSLCDAVLDAGGSARMLERIERSNLFLVALDTTRVWYRYHALFGDLLRHELELAEPSLAPVIHGRAYAWYRDQGLIPEAIHHALAAGCLYDASELVAIHWNGYFNRGRLETVAGWLDGLGEDRVRDDARLCVARAWLAMDLGRLQDGDRWISAAEASVSTDEKRFPVWPDVAALRAVHSFKVGNLVEAQLASRRVLDLQADGPFPPTVAHCVLGAALYWAGRPSEAVPVLERAVELARPADNDLATSYALGYLALVHADRGELEQADRLADAAVGPQDDAGRGEHFVTMVAQLARARVAARRRDPEAAERATRRGLELARRGAGAHEVAGTLLALAEVRSASAREEARALAQQARGILARCGEIGPLAARLETVERAVRVRRRGVPEAHAEELTDRERAVLPLLASELSLRQIGHELFVSHNTVKTHTRGIYRKLDVSSRDEAVTRAHELGLL
jgi:LuxR family maltose regulon positive regulatory protein